LVLGLEIGLNIGLGMLVLGSTIGSGISNSLVYSNSNPNLVTEWVFGTLGDTGRWLMDKTVRRPDILTFEVGLHTCTHAVQPGFTNVSMIKQHEDLIPTLMKAVTG
jgi:hypothetical protein